MGLSDQERYAGVIACVNELYNIPRFKEYEFKGINRFLKSLWEDLFYQSGNSMHWIVGSSTSSGRIQAQDCLGASFIAASSEFISESQERTIPEDYPHKEVAQYLDYYCPKASSLLEHVGAEYANLWKIFQLTESIFYYLNRYPGDEFACRLRKVSKTISNIQGYCYKIFSTHQEFLQAWMLGNLFNQILKEDSKDVVTKIFMKQNFHHYVRINNLSLKETYSLFKRYQSRKVQMATNIRMQLVLKLVGSDNQYPHIHKKIMEEVVEYNKKHTKDKKELVDVEMVKRLCAASLREQKKFQKIPHHTYCDLTGQEI
jgi:hypothetical protein